MGALLESITGYTTAAGATFTPLTMYSPDTLDIRPTVGASKAYMIAVHNRNQVKGSLQITSPYMHDSTIGVNYDLAANQVEPLNVLRYPQIVVSKDTLVAQQKGSTVAGDVETTSLHMYYENVDGLNANLTDNLTVLSQYKNGDKPYTTFQVHNAIVSSGAGVGYSGAQALNTTSKQMKSGRKYALLGAVCDVQCHGVRILAPDLGNVGVIIPLSVTNKNLSANWFSYLTDLTGIPLIPVIDMSVPGNVSLSIIADENNGTFNVTTLWVLLG